MDGQSTQDTNHNEVESLRKRVAELEEKLTATEQTLRRYTHIVREMPLGLHVYRLEDLNDDRTLRILDANPAAEIITGINTDQLLGKTVDEGFPGVRERGIPQAYAEVVRRGKSLAKEELFYNDAGVLQAAITINAFPLPDQQLGVTFEQITERKRTEQILQENEHRLRSLISSLPIVQFALDHEGIFTLSEGQGLYKLGLVPGQVVGMSVFEFYRNIPAIQEQMRRCLAGEPVRYRAAVGDVIFEVICNPVYNDQRRLTGVVGVGIDVSEQVRAEHETARLMSIIENTPDIVGTADREGNVVYINRAGRRLRGIPDDMDITSLHIADFHPAWAAELVLNEAIPRAMHEGFWSGDNVMLNEHGEEIPVSQVVLPHLNAAGELEYTTGMMRDISERRRIEAAARESEQRLRQFLNALPVGVFVIEPNGQPFYVNQMAMDILGRGVAPNLDTNQLAEVYNAYIAGTQEMYPTERMPLVRSLVGERSMIDDMEIQQPDQRVLLEIHGAPIVDANGKIIYGLAAFNNITLRRQAEAAVRQHAFQQELIAAQQAALRELSTPLMPIAEGIVVMPIIGSIDSTRAQQIMETLLEGIMQHDADIALLDITGVKVVDTQVAGALIRAAQAAHMLGTEVVLSGIGPEIAQTLVHIGAELREMITKRSLRQGIAYALARRKKDVESR